MIDPLLVEKTTVNDGHVVNADGDKPLTMFLN